MARPCIYSEFIAWTIPILLIIWNLCLVFDNVHIVFLAYTKAPAPGNKIRPLLLYICQRGIEE